MRSADELPLDPDIAAELDAIDATLAGEAVDPRHAELAELTLLLAASRPRADASFAAAQDERVSRRFEQRTPGARRVAWHSWTASLGGLAAALAAAVVVVAVVLSSRGTTARRPTASPAVAAYSARGSARTPELVGPRTATTAMGAALAARSATVSATSASSALDVPAPGSGPVPQPGARKIVQSAELALNTPASRIDTVAQEVFGVVGRESGVVYSSNVTAGASGYGQFHLGVPAGNLGATMSALSQLRYATVSSRTDTTEDVNGQYASDRRRLADDRALRTTLLRQLAGATTPEQVRSLNAQIHDAEASINSDAATLRQLNNRINFSQVSVTLGPAAAAPVSHGSSGFTFGRAWHDAGRVLSILAGVALLVLAIVLPLGIVVVLAWWATIVLRRRRREQALDLA